MLCGGYVVAMWWIYSRYVYKCGVIYVVIYVVICGVICVVICGVIRV